MALFPHEVIDSKHTSGHFVPGQDNLRPGVLGVGISEMGTGILSSQVWGCALWEERGWRGPFGALSLCTSSPPLPPPALYEIGEDTGSENSERFSASLHSLFSLISAFCSAKAMSLHHVQVPWPLAWLGPREPPTGILSSASPLPSSSPLVFVPHPGSVFSHSQGSS